MPVSSNPSRTAAACGFSPGSTRPLGRVNRARLLLRRVDPGFVDPGFVAGLGGSLCGSFFSGSLFCGSIRATCQTPAIRRSTTPPAEISRAIADTVSDTPELASFLLDSLPGSFHVASLCVGLANAESEGEFAIELGMCEVEIAAAIQPVHQLLIRRISHAQPEADPVEAGGCPDVETCTG